ncbi:MAG: DNA translocase FtsK 4TM domain-containing protein [Chloroflexaceae bacterium]
MPAGTSRKKTTTQRKGSTSRTSKAKSSKGKTARKTTRKQETPVFELSLRPEHQRELFALALITLGLGTLLFFITGTTGGIGSVYVLAVQQAFGQGALIVPLVLGMLGVAILIQERMQEARLTGANIIGTLLVLGMLLAILEFRVHTVPLEERTGRGGGLVGYTLINLLDSAVGRPVAMLLVGVMLLAGIMLTFNLTLRELMLGTAQRLGNFWAVVWGAPRREDAHQPLLPPSAQEPTAFLPPPGATEENDFVPTPIAARLTRASLFQRPARKDDKPSAAQSVPPEPADAAQPKKATPAADTSQKPQGKKSKKNTTPAQPPAKPASAAPASTDDEMTQEPLEGFDLPDVHHAWPLPSFEMLEAAVEGGITDEERRERARLIEETLASFKVEARVVGVNTGPAVTQFELQPAVGVKVSKITTLEKDLALALAAQSIRIEAPIPGKGVVGIEIPNSAISMVTMREVVDSEEFEQYKGKLKLPLGKDVSGMPVVADMARMPHLLVAGSTGSGKSVAINAFLCGLLLKHTPENLKLIMVDPKMVELIVYNHIPHLLSPVVTELERVVPTLKWATREMERRYKVFAKHGCRNLETYRQMARRRADLEPMPYILIIIDELADLMMMAPDEIETQICRLAQMARATGIHMIIATQRPSVDVITGLIKANFPSRMAFAVSSQVDSRVILDTPGADQLLGRGDMLYMAADAAKLVRIQGTFVSDREIEKIVSFWRTATPPEMTREQKPKGQESRTKNQQPTAGKPATGAETQDDGNSPSTDERAPDTDAFRPPADFLSVEEQDDLFPQALELVQQHQRASASLLQRRLRIGYSKAAQLIDLLEQQGVVGPAEGGRSREVLHRDEA